MPMSKASVQPPSVIPVGEGQFAEAEPIRCAAYGSAGPGGALSPNRSVAPPATKAKVEPLGLAVTAVKPPGPPLSCVSSSRIGQASANKSRFGLDGPTFVRVP